MSGCEPATTAEVISTAITGLTARERTLRVPDRLMLAVVQAARTFRCAMRAITERGKNR